MDLAKLHLIVFKWVVDGEKMLHFSVWAICNRSNVNDFAPVLPRINRLV